MDSVFGKPFIRPDSLEKVSGQARYTADLTTTALLHAKFLYSEHPHARIRSIRTDKAKALSGVHAVLTQADVPSVRYGAFIKDRTLFADGIVRFESEVVAAVAAQTEEVAAQACLLIEVDYELLPSILDPEIALLAIPSSMALRLDPRYPRPAYSGAGSQVRYPVSWCRSAS